MAPTLEPDLIEITGEALGKTLARKGIRTRDDLADLAVDELVEMGSVDEKKAARTDHECPQALVRGRSLRFRSKYGRCNRRAIRRGAEGFRSIGCCSSSIRPASKSTALKHDQRGRQA